MVRGRATPGTLPVEVPSMHRNHLIGGLLGAVALATLLVVRPSFSSGRNEEKKEAGKSATADLLPVAQVVLFSSGVGYFQREGAVEGDQRIDLSFPTQD